MKAQYSAAELAAMRIDGLPTTEKGIRLRAEKDGWQFVEVSGRGGRNGTRREYPVASLPAPVRSALLARAVHNLDEKEPGHGPETPVRLPCENGTAVQKGRHTQPAGRNAGVPAPLVADQPGTAGEDKSNRRAAAGLTTAADATEADRAQSQAAKQIVARVDQLAASAGCSIKAACQTLINSARGGLLPAAMVATLRQSRDRRGRPSPDGLPSARSLERWVAERREGSELLPEKRTADMTVAPWYALAIALKQRPQKPTYKWIHEQIEAQWDTAWGNEPPSYDVVYRFFRQKMSRIEQLKGQHLGSSLRAHMFYQHRSGAGLAPFVEVHADGWNTHFTAPHPVTGEFVTLEVWHFHDVATRYVTPPSIGLSESFEVIAKGLENCIRVGGVPAVWQTDSTGSVKNDRMKLDPVASIAERGGIEIVHPQTVGNSQANGICENFNTYLDREARELATYQGAKMDSLALKRVKKLTEKMVKAQRDGDMATRDAMKREAQRAGKGLVFESYDHARQWLLSKIEKFNRSPHSALPKISDPRTGKKRHQTPAEALAAAREAGWEAVLMDEAHLVDLFRPHVRKTVRRGTVSPFGGQRYYHSDLPHYEGEEVMVAIDIMDAAQVWVKDLEGRLICVADFVEATGYRSMSMYEYALEKRARAQIKRKESQIEQIEQRMAAPAIEAPAAPVIDIVMQLASEAVDAAATPATKPLPEVLQAEPVTPEDRPREKTDFGAGADLALLLYGDVIDNQWKDEKDDGKPSFKKATG